MDKLNTLLVGNGKSGYYHQKNYPDSFELTGIVDEDADQFLPELNNYENLEKALMENQYDVVDIAAPTQTHLDILENLSNTGYAENVIIEKPVCKRDQIEELRKRNFSFNVSVNENYRSSKVLSEFSQLYDKLDFKNPDIVVEFSKSRKQDMLNGRFVDKDWLVWGYEGPHMLAILDELTGPVDSLEVLQSSLEDMYIHNKFYPNQGTGEALLENKGQDIELYTSMRGHTRNEGHIDFGQDRRVRYIRAEENGIEIQGFFEPVQGLERPRGMIKINDGSEEIRVLEDDSLSLHMNAINEFFQGESANPAPLEKELDNLELMAEFIPDNY